MNNIRQNVEAFVDVMAVPALFGTLAAYTGIVAAMVIAGLNGLQ